MQSETADCATGAATARIGLKYTSSLILVHSLHNVKTWRHPQNLNYVTYCIAATGWPRHCHWGNM